MPDGMSTSAIAHYHSDSLSPLLTTSPYHAFAPAIPLVYSHEHKQHGASQTTARFVWNETSLALCWELEAIPETADTRVVSDRVICNIWSPLESRVWKYELTTGSGKVDASSLRIHGDKLLEDESDLSKAVKGTWHGKLAVGWGGASSPVPSAVGGMSPGFKEVLILEIEWKSLGVSLLHP